MFKLAVGNVVEFPVQFTMRDGGANKDYSFTLKAERKLPDEIEAMGDSVTVGEMLRQVVRGWRGQRLALGADDQPAAYSPEALEFLLKVPGVFPAVWGAYQKACGATAKN